MCIIPNALMERDPMLQNCIEIYVLKNSKMLKKLHEIILWVSFLFARNVSGGYKIE